MVLRLMEALFDMHSFNRESLVDLERYMFSEKPTAQSAEQKKLLESLWSRHQKAADEVQKIAVMGAFIVSDAVADDLMQLRKAGATEFSDDPMKAYEKEIEAIEEA